VLANLAVFLTADRHNSSARRNALTGLLGPLSSLLLTARWELPMNSQVLAWHPDNPVMLSPPASIDPITDSAFAPLFALC